MKALWTGTDALLLAHTPGALSWKKRPYVYGLRLFARVLDFFAEEHQVDHAGLAAHLRAFGVRKPVTVRADALRHPTPYPRRVHDGYNVLYYWPTGGTSDLGFKRWLYGRDLFERLQGDVDGVNWIVVDGSADMADVLPIVDAYIRPNRHDGASRLRQECEVNRIPVYWTRTDPDYQRLKNFVEAHRA